MRTLRQWVWILMMAIGSASSVAADDLHALPQPADSTASRLEPEDRIPWRPEGLGGRPDLYQHASLAFASGLAIGIVSESPAAAAGTSISIGVAKEFLDPRFDRTDLLADLVGATLAALVTHWVTR